LNEIKTNKLGKIYSIFSVVFIGAIGSGVWDLFLKDLIFYAGEVFVNSMSSMYSGYFDRLFENVGVQSKALMYLPSIFIVMLIIAAPFFVYIKIRRMLRHIDEESNELNNSQSISFLFGLAKTKQRLFTSIIMVPLFLISLMYTDLLIKSLTNVSAINNMERWLTVVRPYVKEKDYHLLVSEFRMINSRLSYQLLVNKIERYASEQSVLLPKMQIYGIETANKKINKDT
jgi:hypothetical protein